MSSVVSTLEHSLPELASLSLLHEVREFLSQGELTKAHGLILEARSKGRILSEPLQRLDGILSHQAVVSQPITAPERTSEAAWVKANWTHYQGKWVAVLDDQAVASGDTLKEVLATVREKKLDRTPIIHRIK
jgi:hypothetical protein